MTAPFDPSSVSLAISVVGRDGREQAAGIVEQARAAELAGFDGVTIAEHHAGFEAYMPQPLLAASWVLSETEHVWVAPCPVLLSIRQPALVAEQIAWTAARFPGRLGVGLGAGYLPGDLHPFGSSAVEAGPAYLAALGVLRETLAGATSLGSDPAIRDGARVPIISAASTPKGVRRAAELGLGLALVGGADVADGAGRLVAHFLEQGGAGPLLYTRRTWAGEVDPDTLATLERAYVEWRKVSATGGDVLIGDDASIAERLLREARAVGPVGLNVRFHVPGVSLRQVLAQIERFGAATLPLLRRGAAPTGVR